MSLATYGPYALLREFDRDELAVTWVARFLAVESDDPRLVRVRFHTEQALRREEMPARLQAELDGAARRNHVNVAQTFDVAKEGPRTYSVHEHVDGTTLERIVELSQRASRPVQPDVAVFLVAELCAGLAYAHGRRDPRGQPMGLVHTDIRPRRIAISSHGEVKLEGFGEARARLEVEGEAELRREDRLRYAAPELARLDAWDQRADVFSVGAVLYTLLAGRAPFHDLSGAELLSYARRGDFEALHLAAPHAPAELVAIAAAAMALDPEERTESAQALRSALAGWLRSNAPGFGRHRLKMWLQKDLPEALEGATADEGTPLLRREFTPADPFSLLAPTPRDDDRRDPVEDLLAGKAPREAAPAAPTARPTPTGSRPPSLPTRQPGLGARAAAPASALFEEAEDTGPADDEAPPEPERPRAEGPAEGVIVALDGDEDAPLPAAPIPRPPEPVLGRPPEPRLGDARRHEAAPVAAAPEPEEDPLAKFDPDAIANEVWDEGADLADLPDPLADDAPVRRAFPWKTAAAGLLALGLGVWGGMAVWDQMRAGSVSSQPEVTRDSVRLFVTSRPQGATVVVDGQPTELRTPTLLEPMALGRQVLVELRLDGFENPAAQPVVVAEDLGELVFELPPSPHTIHLNTDPEGASVLVDGELRGTTPLAIGPMRVDYRRGLAVLITREGYLDEVRNLDWLPGQAQSSYTVPLREDPDWVAPEAVDEAL